jgi:hypothetical protein
MDEFKKAKHFSPALASIPWTGNQLPGYIVSGLWYTCIERFPAPLFDCGPTNLDRPKKRFFKGLLGKRIDEFWNHPSNLAI